MIKFRKSEGRYKCPEHGIVDNDGLTKITIVEKGDYGFTKDLCLLCLDKALYDIGLKVSGKLRYK